MKRAKLSTHQRFPNIAGCGTSTRDERCPAARRSIAADAAAADPVLASAGVRQRHLPTAPDRVTGAEPTNDDTAAGVAGGHHQVDLGCARAAPQLRMLRRRSSARLDGGDDLHLRVHLLPSLRRRPPNGYVSQLRRQLVPPADPTRCPARPQPAVTAAHPHRNPVSAAVSQRPPPHARRVLTIGLAIQVGSGTGVVNDH